MINPAAIAKIARHFADAAVATSLIILSGHCGFLRATKNMRLAPPPVFKTKSATRLPFPAPFRAPQQPRKSKPGAPILLCAQIGEAREELSSSIIVN